VNVIDIRSPLNRFFEWFVDVLESELESIYGFIFLLFLPLWVVQAPSRSFACDRFISSKSVGPDVWDTFMDVDFI
jgi:hypothetical protein